MLSSMYMNDSYRNTLFLIRAGVAGKAGKLLFPGKESSVGSGDSLSPRLVPP